MRPEPIGSETLTNTIGILRLSRCNAMAIGVEWARITSGCRRSILLTMADTGLGWVQNDNRCGRYGPPTIRAVPALAEIRRGAPSFVGRPRPNRRAHRFAGPDRTARALSMAMPQSRRQEM